MLGESSMFFVSTQQMRQYSQLYIYITNWMRFRMKPFKSIQQLFEDGLTVMASRFWTFFGCFIDTFGCALSFNVWTANKNVGLTLMMWLGLLSKLETAGVCVCVCVGFRSLNMSQSYWSEWLLKNMTMVWPWDSCFHRWFPKSKHDVRCFNREVHLRSEYYVHVFCCVNLLGKL